MDQTLGAVISDLSLEEYLQYASSLCGEKETTVRALNGLEKEQFRIAKLKQVALIFEFVCVWPRSYPFLSPRLTQT